MVVRGPPAHPLAVARGPPEREDVGEYLVGQRRVQEEALVRAHGRRGRAAALAERGEFVAERE